MSFLLIYYTKIWWQYLSQSQESSEKIFLYPTLNFVNVNILDVQFRPFVIDILSGQTHVFITIYEL